MPRVHALIVAAGRGSRFGSAVPKQYLTLKLPNGEHKTVLECSVMALATHQAVNACTLVVAADDTRAQSLDFALPMRYVVGGAERWQSVAAGVRNIVLQGAAEDDLVLIHDAARPCLQPKDLQAVIATADQAPYGAILGVPVVDTLKKVKTQDGALVAHDTVSRDGLWQVQTPQVFRLKHLLRVIGFIERQAISADVTVTDEAMGFEVLGLPVCMVMGSRSNIKLTYADELPLLRALLSINFPSSFEEVNAHV